MSLKIKDQTIEQILSALMLLTLLNSAYFFLSIVKLPIAYWLAFNACSLAIIVYLICFVMYKVTGKYTFMAIALVPLYYYGTMGLFVVSWNQANLFAHITHVIITLNVIRILYCLLRKSGYESIGIGMLAGVLLFVPIFAVVQSYSQANMNEIIALLQQIQ